jgi:8-oxo-dGTP pyrophosphatase MutT (NUDIX family)
MTTTMVYRRAVRALILTPDRELLLMRIRLPDSGEAIWIAPGGGIEPGESTQEALRRELREELGFDAPFTLGPVLWRRQHTFNWAGTRLCQTEAYYALPIPRFSPTMNDPIEGRVLQQFRWWNVSELGDATERLTPLSLPSIVSRYLAQGPPRHPVELEVLVD